MAHCCVAPAAGVGWRRTGTRLLRNTTATSQPHQGRQPGLGWGWCPCSQEQRLEPATCGWLGLSCGAPWLRGKARIALFSARALQPLSSWLTMGCAHSRAPAESCSVLRAPGSVPRAVHSHHDPAAYWWGAQQSLTLGCVQAPQKQNLMGRAPCPYPKPSKLRWNLHSFSVWFHSWVPVGGFCPPPTSTGTPLHCTALHRIPGTEES